jgi:hypothetical protein
VRRGEVDSDCLILHAPLTPTFSNFNFPSVVGSPIPSQFMSQNPVNIVGSMPQMM